MQDVAVPDVTRNKRVILTPNTHQVIGLLVHGILLFSIVVATTILTLQKAINGDAAVGLFGAVAATTAGTTAYRAGVRAGDRSPEQGNGS